MVFNKKDLAKAFSPNKAKKFVKKRLSGTTKPSTSGSTMRKETSAETSIKVIVRCRPPNERENQDNYRTVIKLVDDKMLIFDPKEEENPFFYRGVVQKGRDLLKKQNKELNFIFDRVFGIESTNEDIFQGSTRDLILNLLDGYNCSVFAYGATGAGKTHTMLGKDGDPGITYRTMAELFNQINLQKEQRNFELGVTYLEVYNENVQDLLHKSGPLHLREDGRCGIIVAGLKIITIRSPDELLSLLARGNKNRTQHPTDANEESSRSHAVFQVYVNITSKLDGQVKQVKLSMIDLAGSERASATGGKGARFKEGANINKSLLALGNCINNLADGIKHIPYRESKLTRLLKDSLGGNCQTVMIANVSPSSMSYEDTCNTLRYANRAKKIKTSIKKNIVDCQMHVTTYIKMVEEQKREIALLKQQIQSLESGSKTVSATPRDTKTDENNKLIVDFGNKLEELYRRKKILNEKILSLESSDKVLCCRIQYKKAADNRLHNLTTSVDALSQEEQNASGKSRLNKSLQHFKRQRDGIQNQMNSIWKELSKVENELQTLQNEIKSKDLTEKLREKTSLLQMEVERTRLQQQCEHGKRINSLEQCEMHSDLTIIKMLSSTVQTYYNMMRGYGAVNEKMKIEFKQLIKSLEGVRNIKWSDLESATTEEDFYSMTILDVLDNPLTGEMPIFQPTALDEQEQQQQQSSPESIDGTPTGITATIEPHNLTVTLEESTNTLDTDAEASNRTIDVSKLNSTINLQEPKFRKRILHDKNTGPGRTPPKFIRKISPKNKVIQNSSTISGKENNNKEAPKLFMSAKSIAILNKLKSDKLKTLPPPPPSSNFASNDQSDATLKVVRGKERRALTSSHHPYQKNIVKPK